jgi:hypothetical protein
MKVGMSPFITSFSLDCSWFLDGRLLNYADSGQEVLCFNANRQCKVLWRAPICLEVLECGLDFKLYFEVGIIRVYP